jgi:hypothetical protein
MKRLDGFIAAQSEDEWQERKSSKDRFGVLVGLADFYLI